MILYHTLSLKNLTTQIRPDGFYSHHHEGIWCCNDPDQAWNACQYKGMLKTTIEIDTTKLNVDNFKDFYNYYIIRESFIAKDYIADWNIVLLEIEDYQKMVDIKV